MALNHHLITNNVRFSSTSTSTLTHSFQKQQQQHQLLSFQHANRVFFPASKTSPHQYLLLCHHAATDENRRTGGYAPSIWCHDVLEKLGNDFQGEHYQRRVETLKENVRKLLQNKANNGETTTASSVVVLLQLVNDIERLGLKYHFEEDIKIALDAIKNITIDNNDLHTTALHFRILRQNGIKVSQDVFTSFKDPHGYFRENLSQDIEGILSLYEASYLGTVGEDTMDEAKVFARRHLMNNNAKGNTYSELVYHSLKLPLHLNVTMLEARWYIDTYSTRENSNMILLELAKLDYNMVQACYQKEAVNLSRWWKNLGLTKAMPFTRDNVVESFFGAMGATNEPQYKYCREAITKLLSFINTVDDIYDVYATLDEAKLFTDAVERWSVDAAKRLPDNLKLCFFALFNTVNEIAYNTFKETGFNVIPYLQKMWVNQCKAYLLEAEWFSTGYNPTLEEYLGNGWVSVTAPMLAMHTYVIMCPNITTEPLDYLASSPKIIYCLGMIQRLVDDMGTYKTESIRGDVPKSIACYMHDKCVTEEVALENLRHLTDAMWKEMNTEFWTEHILPKPFVQFVFNLARATESTYQHRNGFFDVDHLEDQISTLLVHNVPVM